MNEMDVTAPKDFIHILKKVFFFSNLWSFGGSVIAVCKEGPPVVTVGYNVKCFEKSKRVLSRQR